MNRRADRGDERRGRGDGVPVATWQAIVVTGVAAIAYIFRDLLKLLRKVKEADELGRWLADAWWWLANIFKRVRTDEVPNGGLYVIADPFKWAFLLAVVLLSVLVGVIVGIYLGYTFARAIEYAHEAVVQRFPGLFRNAGHPAVEEAVG